MEFIFSHNSKRLSYVSPWCSTTTSNMSRLVHVTMKGEASHCLLSHSLGNTLQIERVKYMYMYTYYISSSVQWKCTTYAIVTERSVPPIQFLPIIGQRICWHNCNDNLQLVNKCTNLNKSCIQAGCWIAIYQFDTNVVSPYSIRVEQFCGRSSPLPLPALIIRAPQHSSLPGVVYTRDHFQYNLIARGIHIVHLHTNKM